MAAIFSGFESHRAYVGRGGKKEKPKNETELKQSLLRVWHRYHKEVGRFRAKSIE